MTVKFPITFNLYSSHQPANEICQQWALELAHRIISEVTALHPLLYLPKDFVYIYDS